MSGASLILTTSFDAGAGEITRRRFVEGGSTDAGEAVAFSPEGPDRLLDIPVVSYVVAAAFLACMQMPTPGGRSERISDRMWRAVAAAGLDRQGH